MTTLSEKREQIDDYYRLDYHYNECYVKKFIKKLVKWNADLSDRRTLKKFLEDEAGEELVT